MADVFFLLVLLTVPIQLNKFFFPNSSLVLGLPIDYLALAIYLSDIFVWAFIASSVFGNIKALPKIFRKYKLVISTLALLNLYLALNTAFVAHFSQSALFFNLKITEFSLLGTFAIAEFANRNLSGKIQKALTFCLIWQSTLVVLQFVHQKSLGVFLLGERTFDTTTTGIAHFEFLGSQFLRPYGTFPHPNVLAAFLLIYLLLLVPKVRPALKTVLPVTTALLLTFGKAAILAAVLALLISWRKRVYLLFFLVMVLILSLPFFRLPQIQVNSIAERLTLSSAAMQIIKANWLFGVGNANFIPELAKLNLFASGDYRLLQPVHNVFLLIASQNGLFGLLFFIIFLATVAANLRTKTQTAIAIVLLVFLSVDHFIWTLQQGMLLFWLSIAFILSYPKNV